VQQFNVKDYGARGDNSANDTVKIQAAINAAAPVSGMVVIPSGTYLITQPLNVPANVTISGTGTIRQSSAGTYGLWIKGSNVTIDGIGLLGPNNNLTFVDPEYAIYGSGTVNTPLENITIKNTTISKWGAYGVRVEHLQNFTISGNTVTDIGYSGIGVLTARQGTIIGNTIDNITPGSDGNMYGIAMSFVGDEATSTDIVVRDNTVSRVAWECIDTHGGSRLTIDNNQLLSCGVGVAIVNGLIAERTSKDIVITNNYIDAQKDYYTSPKDVGIILQGFDDGSGGITPVTGRITGNTIRNVQVGVYYFETNGLEISNNNFEQCIGWGVFALRNNTNFRIINNNFKDMWSNSTWTAAIHTASSNGTNTGLISNNSLLRATKQATYINQYGYYYRGGMSGITVNNNNFAAATVAPIAGEP
jgi:parallel beta-helix repeat protein